MRHAARRAARVPALLTLLVLAAVPLSAPAVREVGGGALEGLRLEHDLDFLLLAPICVVLDVLTALTVSQHIALVTMLLGAAGILRFYRGMATRSLLCPRRHGAAWAAAFLALAYLLGTYAAGGLLPRPMSRLAAVSPDHLVLDFHSHTSASWDARRRLTDEARFEWLRRAGFHAAYVTDHRSLWPPEAIRERNPARAGDGLVLLPGIEVGGRGEHLNVLGVGTNDSLRFDRGDLGDRWMAERWGLRTRPVVILTIPAKLREALGDGVLQAVEVSDGAPRGLQYGWRHRDDLLRLADSLGLAIVAGTDAHGWGSAAVSWSVMFIPGWRDLAPEDLDERIRAQIHELGRNAVRVVERPPLLGTGTAWGTALVVPLVAHAVFTRLSRAERVAWIGWVWGAWGVALGAMTLRHLGMRVRRARGIRAATTRRKVVGARAA